MLPVIYIKIIFWYHNTEFHGKFCYKCILGKYVSTFRDFCMRDASGTVMVQYYLFLQILKINFCTLS